MKPAEVVTHGLDNVAVVVINDHGGHPCLSGTWLACDNEGRRILLRPCFTLYHGRPDNRVEKGIHLFGGKTSDFFQLFFVSLEELTEEKSWSAVYFVSWHMPL